MKKAYDSVNHEYLIKCIESEYGAADNKDALTGKDTDNRPTRDDNGEEIGGYCRVGACRHCCLYCAG